MPDATPATLPRTSPTVPTVGRVSASPGLALPTPVGATLLIKTAPPEPDGWKVYSDVVGATTGFVWALAVLIAVCLLRHPLRMLIEAFSSRVKDPNASIVIGPIELKRIEVLESKLASQAESNQVDRQVLTARPSPLKSPNTESVATPAERLAELADRYQNVDVPDWTERVRIKDDIAAEMAQLVIAHRLPREELARNPNEGIRMALATAINTMPLPDDARWIQIAAPGVRLKHVRYRFMMAIARLVQLGYINPAQAVAFGKLADSYRANADQSLSRRIDRTLLVLSAAT